MEFFITVQKISDKLKKEIKTEEEEEEAIRSKLISFIFVS